MNVPVLTPEDRCLVRHGTWRVIEFPRSTRRQVLATEDPDAALSFTFRGMFLSLILPPTWQHPGPQYGVMAAARTGFDPTGAQAVLAVEVDGELSAIVPALSAPLENEVWRGRDGEHRAVVRRAVPSAHTMMIEGLRFSNRALGSVAFRVFGEEAIYLNDIRVEVWTRGQCVLDRIERNPRSGACRITALPAGRYRLRIMAMGWQTIDRDNVDIVAGAQIDLDDIYLRRDRRARGVTYGVMTPGPGRPAIRPPGASFRLSMLLDAAMSIDRVHLVSEHTVVDLPFKVVDRREPGDILLTAEAGIPRNLPLDLYDLEVAVTGWNEPCVAASAVHVAPNPDSSFQLVGFGHTDTWGQETAEYLARLVDVINIVHPAMVLISNEVNPGYLAGSLSRLRVPYVIGSGNHSYPGFERFFGPRIHAIDMGIMRVVNFCHPWSADWRPVRQLFEDRLDAGFRAINAFEGDAPMELLDGCGVGLVHDSHGGGVKVAQRGATPTWRVGKGSAESFRLIRVEGGRVISAGCGDSPLAPFTVLRGGESPLHVSFDYGADASSAHIVNTFPHHFELARIRFVLPPGHWRCDDATILQQFNATRHDATIVDIVADVPSTCERLIRVRR